MACQHCSLSIIIPTLNSEKNLKGLLIALEPALKTLKAKIIVVDGGSTDHSCDVAIRYGARVIQTEKGRGIQLHRGAQKSESEWFLFLHSDSLPGKGFLKTLITHLQNYPQKAGYFSLIFDQTHWRARLLAFFVALRCHFFKLPYGDQGLLIHRALYFEKDGYKNLPLMEDVDFVKTLGRHHLSQLDGSMITSAERYEKEGYLRRSFKNILLLLGYFIGIEPHKLYRFYYRSSS